VSLCLKHVIKSGNTAFAQRPTSKEDCNSSVTVTFRESISRKWSCFPFHFFTAVHDCFGLRCKWYSRRKITARDTVPLYVTFVRSEDAVFFNWYNCWSVCACTYNDTAPHPHPLLISFSVTHNNLWDTRFSRRRVWRWQPSGFSAVHTRWNRPAMNIYRPDDGSSI
jgi:hypothetical protein